MKGADVIGGWFKHRGSGGMLAVASFIVARGADAEPTLGRCVCVYGLCRPTPSALSPPPSPLPLPRWCCVHSYGVFYLQHSVSEKLTQDEEAEAAAQVVAALAETSST